ncbi:MAG: hypothetical protein LIO79_03800 [Rikenellaceae bacterium]|nr:hypothetical protein [Rikenellaceae bacterium]
METVKRIIKFFIRVLKRSLDPVFIVIVILSFGLWYFNKLNNNYDTNVIIPVKIENNINSSIGIHADTYEVECRVNGQGYRLLRYKLRPETNTEYIDISRLEITPIENSVESEIKASSLFTALSAQITDVNLISILTPQLRIVTSEIKKKRVPVISRISVDYERQYMQVGDIIIDPDSLDVRSVQPLLDTLSGIYTEGRHFQNVNKSLIGYIPLIPVENVVFPIQNVSYSIMVDEYTEVDISISVEVRNMPSGLNPIVLPADADVKLNVSRSRFPDDIGDEVKLYIDFNDSHTNIDKYYRVYYEAGEGIYLRNLNPMYVELLYEIR